MHDDPLGIRQDVNGSTLFELASVGAFGPAPDTGSWIEKLDEQLEVAFRMFEDWCAAEGKACSQPAFRVLNLGMSNKSDWTCLKSKAKNSTVVTDWLATLTPGFVRDEASDVRNECVLAFNNIWKLLEQTKFPNWKLSGDQARFLKVNRSMAILSLHYLSKRCTRFGVYRWRIRPKFHRWDHALRRGVRTRVSPTVFYAFSSEDFMGLVARMCSKTHGASIMKRGVERWILSFFCSFDDSEDEE